MIVAGIDYSMTSPAICIYDTKKPLKFENCQFFFYTGKAKFNQSFGSVHGFIHQEWSCDEERYDQISEWAIQILKKAKVKKVCLEGFAMGAKGRITSIAENTGLLKHKIWKAGIEFVVAAPTSVKKSFSGKGNAKKEDMYQALLDKGLETDLEKVLACKASDSPLADVVDSFAMVHHLVNSKD